MRPLLDRDYLRTRENLFFCVVGYEHPPGFAVAYPKYAPGPGPWKNGFTSFLRLLKEYSMEELEKALKLVNEKYVRWVREFDTYMSIVPLRDVFRHYKPEERLKRLLDTQPKDKLELKLKELTCELADSSSVKPEFLGVTGSVLIGIHGSHSDLDLVVYGFKNALSVKEYMKNPRGKIRRLGKNELTKLLERLSLRKKLPPNLLKPVVKRLWNRGYYGGTPFSIHPVKGWWEVGGVYGENRYKKVGVIRVKAKILSSPDGLFTPARYQVETVDVLEVKPACITRMFNLKRLLVEITSFDSIYSGVFEEGDEVVAYGDLEAVNDRYGFLKGFRVLIGSFKTGDKAFITLKTFT